MRLLCHISGRAQPGKLMDLIPLSLSVFSEAFFVGVDALVTKLIDFSGIARSVFLDLRVYQLSCCRFIKVANFGEFDR